MIYLSWTTQNGKVMRPEDFTDADLIKTVRYLEEQAPLLHEYAALEGERVAGIEGKDFLLKYVPAYADLLAEASRRAERVSA